MILLILAIWTLPVWEDELFRWLRGRNRGRYLWVGTRCRGFKVCSSRNAGKRQAWGSIVLGFKFAADDYFGNSRNIISAAVFVITILSGMGLAQAAAIAGRRRWGGFARKWFPFLKFSILQGFFIQVVIYSWCFWIISEVIPTSFSSRPIWNHTASSPSSIEAIARFDIIESSHNPDWWSVTKCFSIFFNPSLATAVWIAGRRYFKSFCSWKGDHTRRIRRWTKSTNRYSTQNAA